MRLITWNCQGGLHRKHSRIAALKPDILVIPECERLNDIAVDLGEDPVRSIIWKGDNPNKGLGVLSYGDYTLRVHEAYDPRFRQIVPLEVEGPASFVLFAVWTLPDKSSGSYVEPLLGAYEHYRALVREQTVVWAGDFNASLRFDPKLKHHKFGDFVDMAESDRIQSVYHRGKGCGHGDEPNGTFFLYRHLEKKHHIDYAFASRDLLDAGFEVAVGGHEDWKDQSDHMPLICDFHGFSGPRLSYSSRA